ncbi:hypothetical protein CKQ90_30760 [Klebsiella pneumoniae]|nr:hypothetical protein CKQ90_30760 [Klebsiella pneumoniae]
MLLPLLQDMLSDPWFALPAPKSTGREYFNYGWRYRAGKYVAGRLDLAPEGQTVRQGRPMG